MDLRTAAMTASLGVSVVMLVGKGIAAYVSGSDAILSDAAESVVHIVATSFVAFSLWYSKQPADRQHPYGHGKIAYFSIGAEGVLIFGAALSIMVLAGRSLIEGPSLRDVGLGLVLTASMGVINLGLGLFLLFAGRRRNARILVANGHHVLTDMWTSLGVVGGVLAVYLTGIEWLDPVVAILAALYILYNAFQLVREAYHGLMERVEPEDAAKLMGCLEEARASALVSDFHQVHFRQVNDAVWVDVHLLFAEGMGLAQAHRQATEVERRLESCFEGRQTFVTTHLEPVDHTRHHPNGHGELQDPWTE